MGSYLSHAEPTQQSHFVQTTRYFCMVRAALLSTSTYADDIVHVFFVLSTSLRQFIGTRSVSTLTPSQLARKRANNREAQRAVRARTKEHIERLEREVEELKCKQNRDETLQELIRKNKYLKKEIARLRETYGIPALTSHPYAPSSEYHHSTAVHPQCQRTECIV